MTKKYTKAVVASDIHIPRHDPELLSAARKCWLDIADRHGGLDYIFLDGDIIDAGAIARFERSLDASKDSFTAELEQTREFLVNIRKEHPKARIIYVEGNHEYRVRRLIMEPKDRMRWEWLIDFVHLRQSLGLEDLGIEYVEHAGTAGQMKVQYGDCLIGHWGIARSKVGATAHHLMDRYSGYKIVQGHVHHGARVSKQTGRFSVWGIENPCMCPITDVDYTIDPNWQQGFTVLTEVGGVVHSELVIVEQASRTFLCEGNLYEIKKSKNKNKLDPQLIVL